MRLLSILFNFFNLLLLDRKDRNICNLSIFTVNKKNIFASINKYVSNSQLI